ncbi:MAG: 16S rRNA (cytidine(1402)-2'-O)-methyltransferase [Burkholderiales bacterium]
MSEADSVGGVDSQRFRARPGTLYVVATPLGNLRDVTLRALDVLASVDSVAAEDTRVTARLLSHFGIAARTVSLHAHNEAARAQALIGRLAAGESVALVTDAGTPAVSDPGARAVRAVQEAGYPVSPVPGPSALTAAVSVAGLRADAFVFAGFPPHASKARRAWLDRLARIPAAVVMYEAPHRVAATVAEIAQAFAGERDLTVAREITKAFETIARVPLAQAAAWFAEDTNRTRGELVLVVDLPEREDEGAATLDENTERWLQALLEELPPARAARVVAAVTGVPRDVVYARALSLKPGSG